ncbi:hypothetical protein HPB48_017194 [Haemaphysalis longicornis]|uniref:Transposase Tc1-like domain-containing protein n=1 Tax=Haemaphysalis longicornis TaxID=44386 RepID=A0A9J6GH27_HAELO|nr:hypothetical protein HPB48_017194 [Haemaphysalis longicornis]
MPRIDEATRVEILTLLQAGRTRRSIAAEVGCSLGSVTRILRAFLEKCRIKDAARGGCPRQTTEEEDRLIASAANDNPFTTAREIQQKLGLQLSLTTIRDRLHSFGLRSEISGQRTLLTRQNKVVRLEFATRHLLWTTEEWMNVVFTDESTFSSKWEQQRSMWRWFSVYKCIDVMQFPVYKSIEETF